MQNALNEVIGKIFGYKKAAISFKLSQYTLEYRGIPYRNMANPICHMSSNMKTS
jgi:hypothetical protein